MDVLPCGHSVNEAPGRLCPHLVGVEDPPQYHRVLLGRGLASDIICDACSGLADSDRPELVVVCEGCLERAGAEPSDLLGWHGSPGIDERPEPVHARDFDLLGGPGIASPRTIAPTDRGWITVSPDGGVWIHTGGHDEQVGDVTGVEEPPWRRKAPILAVHASADGRFVAVVNDYGRTGVVLDLSSGKTTLRLDRGAYHTEQTPFPAAFVTTRRGDTVLIAATAWNVVDAFVPASGELLTPRPADDEGVERPARTPGYFHGALHASPDGRWMLDDGWVWSPAGLPRAWSIERWLGGNVWEPEVGPSVTTLAQRFYLWDAPMCWVGDTTVAIWGLGPDEELMIDAATLHDVEVGVTLTELAGVPKGRLWSNGRRLFATGDGGLSVWDPYTGERTAHLPDLDPIAYNRALDELLVDDAGRLRRVRLEPDSDAVRRTSG